LSKSINSRGFHHADVINPERCTGCRICALMCPDVCIQVFREKKDGGEK
jgi:2-oxoglutarate ferredoxin oxidoreductase subunit delta